MDRRRRGGGAAGPAPDARRPWAGRRLGLGEGRTVALDNVTLVSKRHGLLSRPDRLVKSGGMVIPEEWKSSGTLRRWHVAQLGVDFVLIEERFGVRPTHGL